jgi:pimeloyl-ACP methyl ester carboxylesterase
MELNLIRTMFEKLLRALRIDKPTPRDMLVEPLAVRKVETFLVKSDGISIRGKIMFPSSRPCMQYPALIVCHGIPGSGTARSVDDPGYDALLERFSGIGLATVFFNFRGCGDSGGDFDMMGWTRDLRVVIDKILETPHIDPTRIMLLGFSGGAATSICVSADSAGIYALASVCSPATFDIFRKDPEEIIEDFKGRGLIKTPGFPTDINQWMKSFQDIEPARWIASFKGKHLLIVHGDSDELIPLSQARELFKKAPAGIKELEIIEGGEHRLRTNKECLQIIENWIIKTLGWKK